MLGFTVASDKVGKSLMEAAVVVLGYVVFCIGNFSALHLSHRQLIKFAAIVRPIAERHQVALTTLQPLSAEAVAGFYWSVVGAVCVGILLIAWRRHARQAMR